MSFPSARVHAIRSLRAKQSMSPRARSMDCFVAGAPRNDGQQSPRDPAAQCPGSEKPPPSKMEGAGNAGCALHPRSRVQDCAKSAHEHTGSAETLRHSLRNGLRAYAGSPATNSSCQRRRRIEGISKPGWARNILRRLDTSNGCQDHTFLPYASALFVLRNRRSLTSKAHPAIFVLRATLPRPPHPIPTSVTIAIRSSTGDETADIAVSRGRQK